MDRLSEVRLLYNDTSYTQVSRSMMVKKADTIMAITKGDGKKEVRFIALLVAFIWTTFTILGVVVLTTDATIPMNVTFIRVCKGDLILPNSVT